MCPDQGSPGRAVRRMKQTLNLDPAPLKTMATDARPHGSCGDSRRPGSWSASAALILVSENM
jgi:hypothetical protein